MITADANELTCDCGNCAAVLAALTATRRRHLAATLAYRARTAWARGELVRARLIAGQRERVLRLAPTRKAA